MLNKILCLCRLLLAADPNKTAEEAGPILADLHEVPPLRALAELLNLDEPAFFCLLLALGCEADGDLRNRVQELLGTPIPTLDLALGLFSRYRSVGSPGHALALADPDYSPLRFLFCMEEEPSRALLQAPLLPRKNILRYVFGGKIVGSRLAPILQDVPDGTLPLFDGTLNWAVSILSAPGGAVLLEGPSGSGKATLARRIAASLGRPCIMIRFELMTELSASALLSHSRQLWVDAGLSRALICIRNYNTEVEVKLCALLQDLPLQVPLLVLSREECCPLPSLSRTFLRSRLEALTPPEWEAINKDFCRTGEQCPRLPYFYATVGRLKMIWENARQLARLDGGACALSVHLSSAIAALGEPLPLTRPVKNCAPWEDLVTAPETLERLGMLETLIRSHQESTSLGTGGITALFYGPSGTGKTMAAGALAARLQMELYAIRISQVLDKYIGETEKHLDQLFAAARRRPCILFFDEADALFSKRTEVSSSHDRYANVETSHLLQCIEEFDGVVLLATNLFKNFDEAFLRRLRMLIRFPMPDATQRRLLWQRSFVAEGLETMLDWDNLAQELELSPAVIRGVARNAAALAGDGGKNVNMELLRALISIELEKTGKLWSLGGSQC